MTRLAKLLPSTAVVGFFLIVLGAKLLLIRTYGSDVPYMDQWDAQARLLYIPRAESRLEAQYFWWPHNEHRVLLTRLLNYALATGNRQWDPLLEMTVNAALHAAFAALLFAFARRLARGAGFIGAGAVLVAVFVLPFGWENTLLGFQSQFYFLLLAALGGLWLTLTSPPLRLQWWGGVIVFVAGLGAMSSAFIAPAAALAVHLLRRAGVERSWSWRDTISAAVLALVAFAGTRMINPVPWHANLRAATWLEWAHAFVNNLAWPANAWLIAALVMQFPIAALLFRQLRCRDLPGLDAVLVGLALWTWLQMAVLAYARGHDIGVNAPRYFDLYAVGVAVNAIALARIVHERRSVLVLAIAAAWVFTIAAGLFAQTRFAYEKGLDLFPRLRAGERAIVRNFVATGDPAVIRNAPGEEWPHPVLETMTSVLSHPGIRALLPVSVRPPSALTAAAQTENFRREAPWNLPGKPEAPVWHAAAGPARFVSEPLPATTLPVLRLTFAASAGLPPEAIRLESIEGRTTSLQIRGFAGDRWQTAHLPLPAGREIRLIAELPAGDHQLAFADPVEMGRGSWLAYSVRKLAEAMIATGAVLLMAALAMLGWREREV